jgi:hypothetical protein
MSAAAEYKAAVEHETAVREHVFLGITERVGPFELRQLTLRDYMVLMAVESPFVMGGFPMPSAVWELLWNQHTGKRSRIRHWWFIKRVIYHRDFPGLLADVRAYVADAFTDIPGGSGNTPKTYYSWAAGIVDVLASEYGWARAEVLSLPMKELGQYIKAIRRRHDSKTILFNKSDSLQNKAVKEANANGC